LEYLSIDGRTISKWIFKKWDWDRDWTDVVQDRDRWLALVNAVMSVRSP
jgi:hypothetical protein